MKRIRMAVFGLLAVGIIGCGKPSESNPAAEQSALQAAHDWLALVDGGSYADSWDHAAAFFQSAVSRADWEKAVQGVRSPLGKVVSRKVKSQQYTSSLPGAPPGEYVVIQYDTTFDNKADAVETVTPMLDKDGQWKVSGYYVK